MKYKLINRTTNEEHLCDKVTIDGFEYYVSGETPKHGNYVTYKNQLFVIQNGDNELFHLSKKVIATTNPNIDIPKVVDEVERLAWEHTDKKYIDVDDDSPSTELNIWNANYLGFQEGYNKSQETHPFSEVDMIQFALWLKTEDTELNAEKYANHTDKDMLNIWKEQRLKTVYYE